MFLFCNGYILLLATLVANSVDIAWTLPLAVQASLGVLLIVGMCCARRSSPKAYFWLTVPMFSVSLLLGLRLPYAAAHFAWAFCLVHIKVGVCMSCCLHRFAAHAAFKCGPVMSIAIGCLGCLANQGGPIWWASKHRAHHKFCDGERDPHSVGRMGEIEAFAFFTRQQGVDEQFAPAHIEGFGMRVIDTFSIVFPFAECLLAWLLLGRGGLWASLASSFLSQTLTLYFNLANHPPSRAAKTQKDDAACLATDASGYAPSNIFLYALSFLQPLVVPYCGEHRHLHHHDHASLARRPGLDWPYHCFIRPLAALQLVWAVKDAP